MNFDKLLGTLNPAADIDPKPIEVSEQRLLQVANNMAAKGYRHTPESLAALHAYLSGYGVLLAGSLGTGKTLFFKTLGVTTISMLDFAGLKEEEARSMITQYYQSDIVLDDVGKEPPCVWSKIEYLAIILEDRLRRTHNRTSFTLNLDEEGFIKRYDDLRLLDRMYQLSKPFKFVGESLRHAIPIKR